MLECSCELQRVEVASKHRSAVADYQLKEAKQAVVLSGSQKSKRRLGMHDNEHYSTKWQQKQWWASRTKAGKTSYTTSHKRGSNVLEMTHGWDIFLFQDHHLLSSMTGTVVT